MLGPREAPLVRGNTPAFTVVMSTLSASGESRGLSEASEPLAGGRSAGTTRRAWRCSALSDEEVDPSVDEAPPLRRCDAIEVRRRIDSGSQLVPHVTLWLPAAVRGVMSARRSSHRSGATSIAWRIPSWGGVTALCPTGGHSSLEHPGGDPTTRSVGATQSP